MPAPKEPEAEHVHGPNCNHDHEHGDAQDYTAHTPYRRQTPKPGRNDPCFCGSGRKFKKCHGAVDA